MKDYLLHLLTQCAPENGFAQDTIQWAIFENKIPLTYVLETDTAQILQRYDSILESYRVMTHAATAGVDYVIASLSLKMITTELTPTTYPARPMRGGPIKPGFKQLPGHWFYEPKYNGWRTLVHVPTGTMFNRHGERLTIHAEFARALALIRSGLRAAEFEWLDCEALERRHKIGQGTLVILDAVPEVEHWPATYIERRQWVQPIVPLAPLDPKSFAENGLYLVPNNFHPGAVLDLWNQLQRLNASAGCEFYEGLVAKRDLPYPIQLQNPERPFLGWLKHRWHWS